MIDGELPDAQIHLGYVHVSDVKPHVKALFDNTLGLKIMLAESNCGFEVCQILRRLDIAKHRYSLLNSQRYSIKNLRV